MNIFITGGTGFIGKGLRTLLLRNGHNVTVLTRNPEAHKSEKAKNQQFVSLDANLTDYMNAADAVVNLAGENIFAPRWTSEKKQRILNSRLRITGAVVKAIREAEEKPGVLVSSSGANIYGNRGDEWLNEHAETANTFLADVCEQWETEAMKAKEEGVRVVIARTGMVLGDGGALDKMAPAFKLFVGGPVGRGNQYISWIHRFDLCRSIIYAIEHDDMKGVYNAGAPNPVTMNEFATTLGEILNRPSIFKVPEVLLKTAMGEVSQLVTDSIRMQPAALENAGFRFRFSQLEEALADIF